MSNVCTRVHSSDIYYTHYEYITQVICAHVYSVYHTTYKCRYIDYTTLYHITWVIYTHVMYTWVYSVVYTTPLEWCTLHYITWVIYTQLYIIKCKCRLHYTGWVVCSVDCNTVLDHLCDSSDVSTNRVYSYEYRIRMYFLIDKCSYSFHQPTIWVHGGGAFPTWMHIEKLPVVC